MSSVNSSLVTLRWPEILVIKSMGHYRKLTTAKMAHPSSAQRSGKFTVPRDKRKGCEGMICPQEDSRHQHNCLGCLNARWTLMAAPRQLEPNKLICGTSQGQTFWSFEIQLPNNLPSKVTFNSGISTYAGGVQKASNSWGSTLYHPVSKTPSWGLFKGIGATFWGGVHPLCDFVNSIQTWCRSQISGGTWSIHYCCCKWEHYSKSYCTKSQNHQLCPEHVEVASTAVLWMVGIAFWFLNNWKRFFFGKLD